MKKFVATMALALLLTTNVGFALEFPTALESGSGKVEFKIEKAESDVITMERVKSAVIVAENPFSISAIDTSESESSYDSRVASAEDAKKYNIEEGANFIAVGEVYQLSTIADGTVEVQMEYESTVAPSVKFNSYKGAETLFVNAQQGDIKAEFTEVIVNGEAVALEQSTPAVEPTTDPSTASPTNESGVIQIVDPSTVQPVAVDEGSTTVVVPPIDPSMVSGGSDVVFDGSGFVVTDETDLNLIQSLTAESMAESTEGSLPATGGVGAGALIASALGLIGIGTRKKK